MKLRPSITLISLICFISLSLNADKTLERLIITEFVPLIHTTEGSSAEPILALNTSYLTLLGNLSLAIQHLEKATPEEEQAACQAIEAHLGAPGQLTMSKQELAKALPKLLAGFRIKAEQEIEQHMPREKTSRKLLRHGLYAAVALGTCYGLYTAYTKSSLATTQLPELKDKAYETFIMPVKNMWGYLTQNANIAQAEESYAKHYTDYIKTKHADTFPLFQPEGIRNLSPEDMTKQIALIVANDISGKDSRFLDEQISVQTNNWMINIFAGSLGSTFFVLAHKNYVNFLKMENSLKLIFGVTTLSLLSVLTYYTGKSGRELYYWYKRSTITELKTAIHDLFLSYNALREAAAPHARDYGLVLYYLAKVELLSSNIASRERADFISSLEPLQDHARPLVEKIRIIKHWYLHFDFLRPLAI